MELNTLQLKFALNSNYITGQEHCYVIPLDKLNTINIYEDFLCVFNNKPSTVLNGHWILMYYKDGQLLYYDPLCLALSKEVVSFFKKFRNAQILKSNLQTQGFKMTSCGYFCLYMSLKLCIKPNLQNIYCDYQP